MAFEIELLPDAWEHLAAFSAREQAILLDVIEEQLRHQPDQAVRNRKPLRPNNLAGWELRVGVYRIFYDIVVDESRVEIIAVGIKQRQQLLIAGKEYNLIMKELALETCDPAVRDLVKLASQDEAIILTEAGEPRYVIGIVDDLDLEALVLSHNQEFMDYLDQARARGRSEGRISLAEARRRLSRSEDSNS